MKKHTFQAYSHSRGLNGQKGAIGSSGVPEGGAKYGVIGVNSGSRVVEGIRPGSSSLFSKGQKGYGNELIGALKNPMVRQQFYDDEHM